MLESLRQALGHRPWTAILIPSGTPEADRFICSADLLRRLVGLRPGDPGLILQPVEGALNGLLTLTDVFPMFRHALARSADWPGMLFFWTPQGQVGFLPFPSEIPLEIEAAAHWTFEQLAEMAATDLDALSTQYARKFPKDYTQPSGYVDDSSFERHPPRKYRSE